MTNNDKLYFRRLLNGWLKELTTKTTGNASGEEWEYLPDIIDRASVEVSRELAFHVRERERQLVRKIRRALESIEEGTFGICEECEEEIPIPRLKARPVTTLCITCKQQQETAERMTA